MLRSGVSTVPLFQHSAARRRLAKTKAIFPFSNCFNTQPPEGGCDELHPRPAGVQVSTLSRPKAAGIMKAPYQ